jgi:hypothetical protein
MLKQLIWTDPIRRLAAYGVALPFAVIIACNALRRTLGEQDAIKWTTVIAGFWFIAGTLVTGIALIRDALRRHE